MKHDKFYSLFNKLELEEFPELKDYTRTEIYRDKMGPGALFLAAKMSRKLNLQPGEVVLDLGCGKGLTSLFLAKHFKVTVIAVDLWINPKELAQKTSTYRQQIIPLQLDITKPLPFAHTYFDKIFCMDSIHYYGGEKGFLNHLAPYLKPDGLFCIGSPCFNQEPEFKELTKVPKVYQEYWKDEFSKYHSPSWWFELFKNSSEFIPRESKECSDGILMWEDNFLYDLEQNGFSENLQQDAEEILYGRKNKPYLTHFILLAQKNI